MKLNKENFQQFETDLARISERLAVPRAQGRNILEFKSRTDLLTQEDLLMEQEIIQLIQKRYPEHGILSEELGELRTDSPYTWIIDPLCGSNNYSFGLPTYGISVALLNKREFMYGHIAVPPMKKSIAALRGEGAWDQDRKPTTLHSNIKMRESLILYDNQLSLTPRMQDNLHIIAQVAFAVRISGSAAYDSFMIANGVASARIFNRTKIFDFAASAAIMPELGASIIDFDGRPVGVDSSEIIVAAHPHLANELRNLLQPKKQWHQMHYI